MNDKQLSYDDLNISLAEIYEQMGYGDAAPDETLVSELQDLLAHVKTFLKPSFAYFVLAGECDAQNYLLKPVATTQETMFSIGRIIARQLQGAEAYAFFVCTAGMEYEQYQENLKQEGDMVKVFMADALGSVIAEKCADAMEVALQESIDKLGWKHTNRFSPGYCGWHVSQQQLLFDMFAERGVCHPCGVSLTPSSLMMPIKSVSGVIGLGKKVRKLEYTCGLCDYQKCYKRRKKA